ncbi:hypothetical protein P4O66_014361 [Electrophorus voltai]|uniref:Uncharacterized protein n=1 Tax=Electrophorus voltai TaxID=2609070 RepID=A0AAD8Z2V8_9TELE|nr:hypothetical protein P4O66_014361 [Electrophorus voltai]
MPMAAIGCSPSGENMLLLLTPGRLFSASPSLSADCRLGTEPRPELLAQATHPRYPSHSGDQCTHMSTPKPDYTNASDGERCFKLALFSIYSSMSAIAGQGEKAKKKKKRGGVRPTAKAEEGRRESPKEKEKEHSNTSRQISVNRSCSGELGETFLWD